MSPKQRNFRVHLNIILLCQRMKTKFKKTLHSGERKIFGKWLKDHQVKKIAEKVCDLCGELNRSRIPINFSIWDLPPVLLKSLRAGRISSDYALVHLLSDNKWESRPINFCQRSSRREEPVSSRQRSSSTPQSMSPEFMVDGLCESYEQQQSYILPHPPWSQFGRYFQFEYKYKIKITFGSAEYELNIYKSYLEFIFWI